MKLVREIDLKYATLCLYDPPLVRLEMLGDLLITEAEARCMTDAIGELSGGQEIPVMMVADELVQFDGAAKAYSASAEGSRFSLAEAIVVRNFAQRLIASFYLKFNKPARPTMVFESEVQAIDWLYSFSQKK